MVNGVPSEKVSTLSFVDLAGTDRRHAKASRIYRINYGQMTKKQMCCSSKGLAGST